MRRRRRISGDLRQLSMQALCTNRDLVLQMPVGIGTTDLSLDVAAPVASVRVRERSEPSVRAAGRRRRGVARDQPSVAQLSVAGAIDAARKGPRRCAICSSCTRASADVERPAADRGHPVGARRAAWCAGCAAPGPLAFGRGLEITVQVDELAFEGAQRVPARIGARSVFRAARVDQLVHGNRAAVREPRARSTDGRPQWGARPTL